MRKIRIVGKISLRDRVVRMLGNDRHFELPVISSHEKQENAQVGIHADLIHYAYHMEIKNALLEAEGQKAQAIYQWEKNRYRSA